MADSLAAMWATCRSTMEWMGDCANSLRHNRFYGWIVDIGASILGFTCLIIFLGTVMIAVAPYLYMAAAYIEQLFK